MSLIDIIPPGAEPVTVAEVKTSARIDGADLDADIGLDITAMRSQAEALIGRRLITQTVELVLDAFHAAEIDLQLPDVQSVTSVIYIDGDGTEQTLAGSAYSLDGVSTPCLLLPAYGTTWPATLDTVNAVRIRFVVGFGDAAADVPAEIRRWIIAKAAETQGIPPSPFVDRLLDAWKVWRFA